MEGVDMLDLYETLGLSADSIYMEIRSGGILVMVVDGESMEGAYTVVGNKITLFEFATGESQEGTVEDGKIIFEMDEGAVMGFQWDPDFVPPLRDDYEPWLDPSLEALSEGPNRITEAGYYRFEPSQPGVWQFETTDSGDGDPKLWIYDSSGDPYAFDDDSGQGYNALVCVSISDFVVVEVSFWDSNTTTTLVITSESSISHDAVEGYIPPGGGVVVIRETQTLEFTMDRAGFWVFYTMNNGSSDPYLTLYDHDGEKYSEDDDSMGDYNALLIVYFDEGEPGSIEAGFNLGDEGYYELVVKPPEMFPDSGGTLAVNAPQTFVFTPDRSGIWTFSTSDENFGDPYLQLFDEHENVWEDDDGGDGYNALLSVELVAGERYHINASFATLGPVTYTLTVS